MPKICREDDSFNTGHSCDSTSKLATPSQTTVFVEGKLVARKGDPTKSHEILVGDTCTPHTSSIVGACSTNVFVKGIGVARIGDAVDAGAMTSGASTVSVN